MNIIKSILNIFTGSLRIISTKDICIFSDNEIFESIAQKQSNISLGIQKYVYLAVLQTPVFPLKPPKEVYFFLGHPVPGSGIIPILIPVSV